MVYNPDIPPERRPMSEPERDYRSPGFVGLNLKHALYLVLAFYDGEIAVAARSRRPSNAIRKRDELRDAYPEIEFRMTSVHEDKWLRMIDAAERNAPMHADDNEAAR